jgi:hypothetical protein
MKVKAPVKQVEEPPTQKQASASSSSESEEEEEEVKQAPSKARLGSAIVE